MTDRNWTYIDPTQTPTAWTVPPEWLKTWKVERRNNRVAAKTPRR